MDSSSLAGSLVLAIMFNWGLYGILLLQTCIYRLASPLFPSDRLFTKVMIYLILLLETVQTAVSSLDVYSSLASSNFGSPTDLDNIRQHWLTVPVFGAITGGIGQFFFAYRIWGLTDPGERGTPILVAVLGLASFGSGIVAGVTFFKSGTFSNLMNNSDNLAAIGVWNGFGSMCDIVIALCMPYYLMRHGTGLRSTHIKVVNIITLLIETGIFVATIVILHLCLYFIKTPAFVVPGMSLSKVYANTILVILNNRIVNKRSNEETECALDTPRSPGTRHNKRAIFTLPSMRQGATGGGTSIVVTKERLIFKLDPEVDRVQSTQVKMDGSQRSRESDHTIYGHAFSSETDLTTDIAMEDFNNHKIV